MVPHINKLTNKVDQTWYGDNAAAMGKTANLHSWWNDISTIGPSYEYYANATKTRLVVKPDHLSKAFAAFEDTDLNITCESHPYLGAAIGTSKYLNEFVSGKVDEWLKELKLLSAIAVSQPHTAFCYLHPWHDQQITFIMHHCWHWLPLQALENIIGLEFILALTGRSPPNDTDRKLMALPARLRGLGIADPSLTSEYKFNA